jgi:hypothetical protein
LTAWEKYIAPIPVEERGDFIRAYHKRLTGGDNEEEKLRCALAWTGWEMATSTFPSSSQSFLSECCFQTKNK